MDQAGDYTVATVANPGTIPTFDKPNLDILPAEQDDLSAIAPILGSETFERSDTLKKLLVYLWRHRDQEFSEYAIATEALGRKADFDSKVDASVRVQIARLRQKLKDFYDREGLDCAIILKIPIGSHCLEVSRQEMDPSHPLYVEPAKGPSNDSQVHEASPAQPRSRQQTLIWLLGTCCLILTVLSSWLLWTTHDGKVSAAPQHTNVEKFWQGLLGDSQKTLIVLPTPIFLSLKKGSDVITMRDVAVNDFTEWQTSPTLKSLFQRYGYGKPVLLQSYTVTSDTFASIALARYLDAIGMGDNVTFVDSGGTPMDALEHNNEVAFGTHYTLHPFQAALDSMTFSMAPNEVYVENRRPAPHEPTLFRRLAENGQRIIEPGIIAVLPGKTARAHLLLLQGERTAALVKFLTSSSGIQSLEQMWKAHGSPRYYETVVYAEMNGTDDPIRVWPLAMHAYPYTGK